MFAAMFVQSQLSSLQEAHAAQLSSQQEASARQLSQQLKTADAIIKELEGAAVSLQNQLAAEVERADGYSRELQRSVPPLPHPCPMLCIDWPARLGLRLSQCLSSGLQICNKMRLPAGLLLTRSGLLRLKRARTDVKQVCSTASGQRVRQHRQFATFARVIVGHGTKPRIRT